MKTKRTERIGESNTWIYEGLTADGTVVYTFETAYRGADGKPAINVPDEGSAWWDSKEEMLADCEAVRIRTEREMAEGYTVGGEKGERSGR